MRTLHLSVNNERYEVIEAGIQTEEYRYIKPYWVIRLFEWKRTKSKITRAEAFDIYEELDDYLSQLEFRHYDAVCLYDTRYRMTFECKGITIGCVRSKWGASDRYYFVVKLGKKI